MSIVKSFTSEIEAQFALNHLASLGIAGVIETDDCGGMRPHLDLSVGVALLVPDSELKPAQEALAEPAIDVNAKAWTCPSCGENIEAGFDICWKCGTEK